MPKNLRFTYANVVSTLALFLALSGGVAFAATKVHTDGILKRAVTSGKLALGAVRSNQIADGAVSAKQIADGAVGARQIAARSIGADQIAAGAIGGPQLADGAVGSKQVGSAAIAPANLQFPVYFAASPVGGSISVPTGEPVAYPVSDSTWAQNPGQLNVVFGGATATLAYDSASNQGSCQVFFEIRVNDRQVGGGGLSTGSTTPETIEQSVGAQPEIDPVAPVTNKLVVRVGSNGGCTQGSTVDSTRFRVLDFG